MQAAVDQIVNAFENLTPSGVQALERIYAVDAYFKDPFNEVQGVPAIQSIFRHMYAQLEQPRFIVSQRIVQGAQCFLSWEFHFAFRGFQPGQVQCIRGGSHLQLNGEGRITSHRDYWDAAEELYEKWPLIGSLMRWLKRRGQA